MTFRILLRSSSLQEPRDPLLKVVCFYDVSSKAANQGYGQGSLGGKAMRERHTKRTQGNANVYTGCIVDLLMILPQVHLRKPCYDFYFL